MRSVHAAAYVIASIGPRYGAGPSTCSSVHALSKPSASARSMKERKATGSNVPSGTCCGMAMPQRRSVVSMVASCAGIVPWTAPYTPSSPSY